MHFFKFPNSKPSTYNFVMYRYTLLAFLAVGISNSTSDFFEPLRMDGSELLYQQISKNYSSMLVRSVLLSLYRLFTR